jgi:hypothetical protein
MKEVRISGSQSHFFSWMNGYNSLKCYANLRHLVLFGKFDGGNLVHYCQWFGHNPGGGGIGNLYFAFTVTKTSISHKHDLNIQALA